MSSVALKCLYQKEELQDIYNARVRHYTIYRHTDLVCDQFYKYFAKVELPVDINLFVTFLSLHDIGKPEAYLKGDKESQHLYTTKIIQEVNIDWGGHHFTDAEKNLIMLLASSNCVGKYFQGRICADEALREFNDISTASTLSLYDVFRLFVIYYQCDSGSYTKDAGGLPFLERLFVYQNGEKVFDTNEQILKFSPMYQSKYLELKNKIMKNNIGCGLAEHANIIMKNGNIFNSNAQTIVNTINCVGVMGKGIALVFKLRYPNMFGQYQEYCRKGLISIGKLWLYKGERNAPWVLNFPTKFHWKYPSKMEYIEQGLQKFVDTYKNKGIISIAFPLLGTHNGGLDKASVLSLMKKYLGLCDIPIEIYDYAPNAHDDLFENFKNKWNSIPNEHKKDATGIRSKKQIEAIDIAVNSPSVKSMITLIEYPGIGLKTMEKCFKLVLNATQ